jgi:hypothetical protein
VSLIFDSILISPSLMGNASLCRKTTRKAFDDIVDAVDPTLPYLMFSFQADDGATLVGVTNEGRDSVLGNLAMSHASMWSAAGFYQNFGRMLQAGNRGQGINSVGGASPYLLSCATHSGSSLAGQTKCTWIYKFLMRGTGGGAAGRLSEAAASHINFCNAANTIASSIYNAATGLWASNTTGATVAYRYWHDLAIVVDTTLVGDANRCKLILDGRDVTTVLAAGMPAVLNDASTVLRILNGNGAACDRAFDGILGFFAMVPGVAMSLAQTQSFIEVMSLMQATVGNQVPILNSGCPEYSFTWADTRNLLTFQVNPFKTTTGTIIACYKPEDFANEGAIMGVCQDGAAAPDNLMIETRGDIALDPLELMGSSGGVTNLRLQHALGVANGYARHCSAWTSDGTAIRAYFDGKPQTLLIPVGANTGQWFASYTLSNAFAVGAKLGLPWGSGFGGKGVKFLVYDREVVGWELAKMASSGYRADGTPRWYTQS